MIVKVRQTKANLKKEFAIYYDGNLQYTGKQSGLSSRNPCWLFKLDDSVRFESSENRKVYWRNWLQCTIVSLAALFVWLATGRILLAMLVPIIVYLLFSRIPGEGMVCAILDSGEEQAARFRFVMEGLLTSYYSVECGGEEYRLYTLGRSHYQYISVYHGDVQIAQINKDLHTVNNRDNYNLYLLDEEAEMADLLTMFILYYDNYEHGDQGEVFVGYKKEWRWTWSKTDRFYDEAWLPAHFGWSEAKDFGYSEE